MNLIQLAKAVLFNRDNHHSVVQAEALLQADVFVAGDLSWANEASTTTKCLQEMQLSSVEELDPYLGYSGEYDYVIDRAALRVIAVPRWTMLTFMVGRNTFSLFQENSVLDLSWYGGRSKPITRQECLSLVEEMTRWMAKPSSEDEANKVGSDLRYVKHYLDQISEGLSKERFQHVDYVTVSAFTDDNRELEAELDRCDAYADAYWSASPED